MDFRSLIPFGRATDPLRPAMDEPFGSLRREMDRIFDSFTRDWPMAANLPAGGALLPRMNVAETDKGLEVTAELPGVDPKDITLDLSEGVLTLKADRKAERETKDEKAQYHLVERTEGSYLRRMALPFPANEDKVEASFDRGVLRILIPRAPEAEKPHRRIEIKAA